MTEKYKATKKSKPPLNAVWYWTLVTGAAIVVSAGAAMGLCLLLAMAIVLVTGEAQPSGLALMALRFLFGVVSVPLAAAYMAAAYSMRREQLAAIRHARRRARRACGIRVKTET